MPLDNVTKGICESFHFDAPMAICIFTFGCMLLGWFCYMRSLRLAIARTHVNTHTHTKKLGSARSTDLFDYNSVETTLSPKNYVSVFVVVVLAVQYIAPSC
jgi:hypothetical protein